MEVGVLRFGMRPFTNGWFMPQRINDFYIIHQLVICEKSPYLTAQLLILTGNQLDQYFGVVYSHEATGAFRKDSQLHSCSTAKQRLLSTTQMLRTMNLHEEVVELISVGQQGLPC